MQQLPAESQKQCFFEGKISRPALMGCNFKSNQIKVKVSSGQTTAGERMKEVLHFMQRAGAADKQIGAAHF